MATTAEDSYGGLAGLVLLLAFATMVGGGTLWATRAGADPGTTRHVWERGLLMAAVILTLAGFALLTVHLRSTPGSRYLVAGALGYGTAAALGLSYELSILRPGATIAHATIAGYVIIAFLAQAAIGLGLAHTPHFPVAIGWTVVTWNVGWLAILPLTTPDDLYFPVLHHLMLPAIGVPLLTQR